MINWTPTARSHGGQEMALVGFPTYTLASPFILLSPPDASMSHTKFSLFFFFPEATQTTFSPSSFPKMKRRTIINGKWQLQKQHQKPTSHSGENAASPPRGIKFSLIKVFTKCYKFAFKIVFLKKKNCLRPSFNYNWLQFCVQLSPIEKNLTLQFSFSVHLHIILFV